MSSAAPATCAANVAEVVARHDVRASARRGRHGSSARRRWSGSRAGRRSPPRRAARPGERRRSRHRQDEQDLLGRVGGRRERVRREDREADGLADRLVRSVGRRKRPSDRARSSSWSSGVRPSRAGRAPRRSRGGRKPTGSCAVARRRPWTHVASVGGRTSRRHQDRPGAPGWSASAGGAGRRGCGRKTPQA